MAETVVKVENLYKKFARSLKRSMYYGTLDISRSMLGIKYPTNTLRKGEFWALDNINFELKKGETLGIIGANGSGKSTLLRLLTGIFPPDVGSVHAKGSIGALIAVGAGFHPHMSGRENIYLNGTILGMTKKEIDAKFNEIVDFSEIGTFLDAPVSTYSSGMRVRLGFSIAVHREPDILLVDEILSVGDQSFRNKSLRKMKDYREKANALIFISHNLEHVRSLCNRVLVMDRGRIIFNGETSEALNNYEEIFRKRRLEENNSLRKNDSESNLIEILNYGLFDENGNETFILNSTQDIVLFIDFRVNVKFEELLISYAILSEDGQKIIWVKNNNSENQRIKNIEPGIYRQVIQFENHNLSSGVYYLSFGVNNAVTLENYIKIQNEKSFCIETGAKNISRGIISVNDDWTLKKIK